MGYPVAESEDMPNIAADSYSVAFGDFRRGYLIVDRVGIRVLRDPYSQKPYVLFYTTKRVGGGVQDFDAIKLLKFGDRLGVSLPRSYTKAEGSRQWARASPTACSLLPCQPIASLRSGSGRRRDAAVRMP